ncbi:hypothetical protein FLO80_19320 [Aquicoccus porphyridii]|uniref:Uncharacterized protein n=1 Tax=Aquicoccus porphyridii TaxID=1852029 RepID=A0A5A9YYF7_9RHOB|nr:hypothetical protein [Aquicoccus porphyridii]KAA0909902.1 hypothetical protein FLO80_19320 [Aquicoccus porphyridii]RAI52825.1 hypothetical protein DOO74_15125 [Rhodobacteraceae bacterium AsT-22]
MTEYPHQRTLKTILVLDAATCTGMGLLLILASGLVARITQIPAPLLFWAGLLLLPVAGFMVLTARDPHASAWAVLVIVAGNLLWVLASLALPMIGVIAPNALGWAFILAQAIAVTLFAWLEWSARHTGVAAS